MQSSFPHLPPRSIDLGPRAGEIYGPNDADKPMIIELAVAAMEELVRMTQTKEPLWILTAENSSEGLNEEEYIRTFPRGIGPKPLGLKSEASRESVLVIMNHINLVEILMDVVGNVIPKTPPIL